MAANNMDRAVNRSAEIGKAFEELSSIALGGHSQARELIGKIDEATATGKLVLPQNKEAHE